MPDTKKLKPTGTTPPRSTIDKRANDADDQSMNEQPTAVEKELATVKTDVAVIRSNYATKEELSAIKMTLEVIRSNYVTKEELYKALQTMTWKVFGFASLLVAGVYFIARYVH